MRVHITVPRWPGYLGICVLILDLRFGLDHCATNKWQCEFGVVNSLCGWVETISKWVVSRADDSTCVWFSWPLCVASGNSYSGCATKWNSARKIFQERNSSEVWIAPCQLYSHWAKYDQTTVDRAASASLNAFLAESAAPCHEGSVSGSNDPMSADLHDDTSSLQPVLRPTEGNPGSGAFPGDGEQSTWTKPMVCHVGRRRTMNRNRWVCKLW